METIFDIVGIALLSAPLLWELHNDQHGDDGFYIVFPKLSAREKDKDVAIRVILAALASWANGHLTGANFWASMFLSGAIHFLSFDYGIAYLLAKNKIIDPCNPFTYLGKKSKVDNFELWRESDPYVRFFFRVIVLVVAAYFYKTL